MATRVLGAQREQKADHAHAHGHRRGFGDLKSDWHSYDGDHFTLREGYDRRHRRKQDKKSWATHGKQKHQANVKAVQQEERDLNERNRQNAKKAASASNKAASSTADKPAKTPVKPTNPKKSPKSKPSKTKTPAPAIAAPAAKGGISPLKAAGLVVGTSVLTSIGNRLADKTAGAVENATTRALEKRNQKPAGNSWEQAARNVK